MTNQMRQEHNYKYKTFMPTYESVSIALNERDRGRVVPAIISEHDGVLVRNNMTLFVVEDANLISVAWRFALSRTLA